MGRNGSPSVLEQRPPETSCDRNDLALSVENPPCTPVIGMRRQLKNPCRRTAFFAGAIIAVNCAARHERHFIVQN
jgi:hypothetical protein